MSEPIFTGTTEEGEKVNLTLDNLMGAEWTWNF